MRKKVMNCPHCGKVLPGEFWHEESQAGKLIIKCPRCGGNRDRKGTKRYTLSGAAFESLFKSKEILPIKQDS